MNFKLVKQWTSIGFVALAVISGLTQHSQAQQTRRLASFYCGTDNGKAATIADHPGRGEVTLIIWESEYFIKAGYNPQRRCREVSDNFQHFQQTGDLSKIVPGRTNNQPVLCAVGSLSNYTGNCPSSNVLMTLRSVDNAQGMANKIAELNLERSVDPLKHSASIFEQYGDIKAINIDAMLNYSPPTK